MHASLPETEAGITWCAGQDSRHNSPGEGRDKDGRGTRQQRDTGTATGKLDSPD